MAKKIKPASQALRTPIIAMVTAAERRRVEQRARVERTTISALGRRALQAYLEQPHGNGVRIMPDSNWTTLTDRKTPVRVRASGRRGTVVAVDHRARQLWVESDTTRARAWYAPEDLEVMEEAADA